MSQTIMTLVIMALAMTFVLLDEYRRTRLFNSRHQTFGRLRVRDIIADQCGVDRARIHPETTFVELFD